MDKRLLILASIIGISMGCASCSTNDCAGCGSDDEEIQMSNTGPTLMTIRSGYVPSSCGDGYKDDNEVCDGEAGLEGYSCKGIFGDGSVGVVRCADNCLSVDKSDCTPPYSCGNGSRGLNEQCDPVAPWSSTYANYFSCSEYGSVGARVCNSMCRWDNEGCSPTSTCGNGVLDEGEQCDPNLPSSYEDVSCENGLGPGSVGFITCNNICRFSYANCTKSSLCGNNVVDTHEVCDGTDLKKKSCKTMGREYSGTLGCLPNCSGYDYTYCDDTTKPNYVCGNGILEPGEVCDGEAGLERYSCLAYYGTGSTGTIGCSPNCLSIDRSGCSIAAGSNCGDGTRQLEEQCDYAIEYTEEQLACPANMVGQKFCDTNCRWNRSNCRVVESCGNGQLDEGEDCDPSVPDSITINCEEARGPGSRGDVTCTKYCTYSYGNCSTPTICGDGIIQNGLNDTPNYHEVCDGTNVTRPNGKKTSCRMLYGIGWTGTVVCLPNCSGYDGTGCIPPAAEP